jgi:hypothetical protein
MFVDFNKVLYFGLNSLKALKVFFFFFQNFYRLDKLEQWLVEKNDRKVKQATLEES